MLSLLLRLVDRFRAPPPDPERIGWMAQWDYAHRGVHGPGVAENSSAAFALAIKAGLGIECDVRRSMDGRAVVFHDASLDRLTEREGQVDRLSIGELTQIPLTVGGETIPTLRDLLDQAAGRVPLLLELKSDPARSVNLLCRAVRSELEGYSGAVAVMSFDPRIAAWFASQAPHITRGLVVTEQERRTLAGALHRHRALWRARPDFLAYDIRDLPSKFAASQRKRGLPLVAWTVSSPALHARAKEHADAPIAEGQGLA